MHHLCRKSVLIGLQKTLGLLTHHHATLPADTGVVKDAPHENLGLQSWGCFLLFEESFAHLLFSLRQPLREACHIFPVLTSSWSCYISFDLPVTFSIAVLCAVKPFCVAESLSSLPHSLWFLNSLYASIAVLQPCELSHYTSMIAVRSEVCDHNSVTSHSSCSFLILCWEAENLIPLDLQLWCFLRGRMNLPHYNVHKALLLCLPFFAFLLSFGLYSLTSVVSWAEPLEKVATFWLTDAPSLWLSSFLRESIVVVKVKALLTKTAAQPAPG